MSFIIFILALIFGNVQGQNVIVNTSRGSVQGFHVDYGPNNGANLYYGQADIFLGIPYVNPPERFQKSQKIDKFPGNSPYNATYFRPMCPQPVSTVVTPNPISEDCLYLNVFTPSALNGSKYPVMLFIHGGAFYQGSAWDYQYKGAVRNLVSRGVVVVTVQYRLGLLGFFTTFTDDFPPNLAMLDQVEAIRFVKDEIPNFGGDPNQITLWGQSAGASSVSAHTYSPLTKGLFQRGILESGNVFLSMDGNYGDWNTSFTRAKQLCNFTEQEWNSRNFTELKSCMMRLNYTEIVALDQEDSGIEWRIVVDGYFLPDKPENLYKNRTNIPILQGTNNDEYALFEILDLITNQKNISDYNEAVLKSKFEYFFSKYLIGQNMDEAWNIVREAYLPRNMTANNSVTWMKAYSDVFTSAYFTSTTAKEIDNWLWNNNSQVYLYEYTYPSKIGLYYPIPGWSPVPHSSEIYLLWMQEYLWNVSMTYGTISQEDYVMAEFFGKTWTDFAKNIMLNTTLGWIPTSLEDHNYFEIGYENKNRDHYHQDAALLWNIVVPEIANSTKIVSTTTPKNGSNVIKICWVNILISSILYLFNLW